MLNESYYNITNELYCNLLSKKLGGARHPLGPMDATPMLVNVIRVLSTNTRT